MPPSFWKGQEAPGGLYPPHLDPTHSILLLMTWIQALWLLICPEASGVSLWQWGPWKPRPASVPVLPLLLFRCSDLHFQELSDLQLVVKCRLFGFPFRESSSCLFFETTLLTELGQDSRRSLAGGSRRCGCQPRTRSSWMGRRGAGALCGRYQNALPACPVLHPWLPRGPGKPRSTLLFGQHDFFSVGL